MRDPFEPQEDETSPPPRSVLVVISDPQLRQLVAWLLDELELPHILVSTWRTAVADRSGPPSLVIADVDDLKGTTAGMVALVSRLGSACAAHHSELSS